MSAHLPQDIIAVKRNGSALSSEEIQTFVEGITDGSISDAQIAALGMAVYFNGMTSDEGAALTLAMRDSGDVIKWTDYGFDVSSPIVDKHSTGGVGDKVSFMLAALAAACGAYVPMIAGRGLGHTGGTVDKLESIPGYNVNLDLAHFAAVTKKVGCSIIGQTATLAPADKRFYAVRDVTATVESIPLITASILSKKLAAGLNSLVMDVKVGTGAFMSTIEDARTLAKSIVSVAGAAGVPTSALITDMNQVLGKSAGNALEIFETIEFLTQPEKADSRLKGVVLDLVAEMLVKSSVETDSQKAKDKALHALTSGQGAEKFAALVTAHGGSSDLIEKASKRLSLAPIVKDVFPKRAGFISSMNVRAIGQTVVSLGGGRRVPGADIDTSVGFAGFVQIGDQVDAHTPLCKIYARSEADALSTEKSILQAITVSDKKVSAGTVVKEIIR